MESEEEYIKGVGNADTYSIIIIGKNKGKRPKSLPNHTDLAYCLIVEKKQKESV